MAKPTKKGEEVEQQPVPAEASANEPVEIDPGESMEDVFGDGPEEDAAESGDPLAGAEEVVLGEEAAAQAAEEPPAGDLEAGAGQQPP